MASLSLPEQSNSFRKCKKRKTKDEQGVYTAKCRFTAISDILRRNKMIQNIIVKKRK